VENHNSITEPDLGFNAESPLRVFNWRWYWYEMHGWSKPSYILLAVGLIFQGIIGSMHGINALAITSTIAGMIGFLCTLAINNKKSLNGIAGFISAAMLIYVASVTGNYSDIIMQGAYIVLLDIPIMFSTNWSKDFKSKRLVGKYIWQTVGTFILFLILTLVLDLYILHSPQAYLDAISATVGLTGAVLTFRQFRSSFYLWTIQGILSMGLWIQTAMNGNPVWVLFFTYMLYLMNDMIAFTSSQWFHEKKK